MVFLASRAIFVSDGIGGLRWGVAGLLCVVSTAASFWVLKSKTGLWEALAGSVKNKITRHGKD